MRKKRFIPFMLCIGLLSECCGAKNIDQLTCVHATGIDHKSGKLKR